MKTSPKRILVEKLVYILLFITIQVGALVVMFQFFRSNFAYFYFFCILLSLLATIHILNSRINPAYKIAWLIPILILPIFGGLLYLLFGKSHFSEKRKAAGAAVQKQISEVFSQQSDCLTAMQQESPQAALQAQYILNTTGIPPCTHTAAEYYPLGDVMYPAMLRELEAAQSFIFLEYFIIQGGVMWDSILDLLERKAKEGVDVRVMYDDLGCFATLPRHYDRELRRRGLRVCVFNPFNSILSPRFNNRDHRKFCIIDGKVGFTGGINLADEYINGYAKHGHWKDTGIMLRGEAAWSMTVQYLALWDFTAQESDDFAQYAPDPAWLAAQPSDGCIQTYTDIPMDDELVGESVYLHLINRAQRYVWITTPYLILDNEMVTALCTAAKSGIDVRIITPHIPDKKIVFVLTRSYYRQLLEAGVRIWEYTPGFIHAKSMLSDDDFGVVGTINLDYRSLYLHVEDAVWLYRSSVLSAMRQDFLDTLAVSQEIHPEDLGRPNCIKQLGLAILHALAPLT